jgi:DNA-binding beta-propeller fold protein YncE
MKRLAPLLLVWLAACAPKTGTSGASPAATPTLPAMPIAVSSAGDGSVTVVDRDSLTAVRRFPAKNPGTVTLPMPLVADARRRVFYVSNFDGTVARIPAAVDAEPQTLTRSAPATGLAISPDGRWLAVNDAFDLEAEVVDLDRFAIVSTASLGTVDAARSRGIASTHPVWLADGSGFLTEDNLHGDAVLVGKDGGVKARRHLRSAIHDFLIAPDGTPVALAEGGAAVVLSLPDLAIARELELTLEPGEPQKLHHGAFSPDGSVLVVANVGNLRDSSATTVEAFRWKTGEALWHVATSRNAGHVAFLGPGKVVVLGHRASEIDVLDAATGTPLASWEVLGAGSLGHALDVAPDGSVTFLDAAIGRLLRYKDGARTAESPVLGDGSAEASLPE